MEPWTLENGVPSGEIGTFPTYYSRSSIEGRKQRRRPETFAPCKGTIPSERVEARKRFSRFKKNLFDISDIPRSGRPSEFDADRLNTLMIHVSVLENEQI